MPLGKVIGVAKILSNGWEWNVTAISPELV